MTTNLPLPYTPPPTPDPQHALACSVAAHTNIGWRVETWTPGNATLVSGARTNHILHLLLSVFTFGLWLPIWLILGLTQKETRLVLSVDQWGQVTNSAALLQARHPAPKTWWDRNYGWVVAAATALVVVLLAAAG